MRPRSALLALLIIGGAARAGEKPRANPEVVVVSDMIGGVEDLRPVAGKPVYYILLGKIERQLGAPIAGEPRPDPAMLEREVEKALASQGFVRTQVGGPMPTLAIVVNWGAANLLWDELGAGSENGETGGSLNQREIAQLVGADKANRRFLSETEAEAINDAARQDRLYLLIGAFDAQALAKKQKRLLWRTRISVESRANSLPNALAVMLASGAPFFAKETEKPVFIDDAARRKAEVIIGTPTIIPTPIDESAVNPPTNKR